MTSLVGPLKAVAWVIRLTLLIQAMLHDLWKTRNDAIHKREDSHVNKHRHDELNSQIDSIYQNLPKSLRPFPQSDAAFFLYSRDRVKHYRIKKKEQWLDDANRILNAFYDNLSVEAENFLDFFDGTC